MLRYRRSLWVVADVAEGEPFTEANVRSLRPEGGLAPVCLDDVMGKRATRDCRRGEVVTWEMVAAR
jgi:N-acetylneuraminate synthase